MKKYEYKFVEIPIVPEKKENKDAARKGAPAAPFDACKEAINSEAADGWRLRQILPPQMSVYGAYGYQVIFEKEVE